MSKVKLRSRSYKLSRSELANLYIINKFRLKLRHQDSSNKIDNEINLSDFTPCKNKVAKDSNFTDTTRPLNDGKSALPIVDKSFESSAAETSSLESQSTSQFSSGVSLEAIEFCKWKQCRLDWINCDNPLYNQPKTIIADELETHLMDVHVKPQLSSKRKFFECLWIGCKVFKKKSLSYSWLERHIIEHTENRNKPFSCIFKCSMRFGSQGLLEKHVQSHLEELGPINLNHSFDIGNALGINCRSKRSCSHQKKYNYLTPYHVHRGDFINKNNFAQIQTNTHLQTIVIDPNILKEFDLEFLKDRPLPPEVIRFLTLEFKIMGKRKSANKISQTLVEWILPSNLKMNAEWINDNLVKLAEYLSMYKDKS